MKGSIAVGLTWFQSWRLPPSTPTLLSTVVLWAPLSTSSISRTCLSSLGWDQNLSPEGEGDREAVANFSLRNHRSVSAKSCDLWLRAGQEGCELGKGGKAITLLLVISQPQPYCFLSHKTLKYAKNKVSTFLCLPLALHMELEKWLQAQGNNHKLNAKYEFLLLLCPVTHCGPLREEVLYDLKNHIGSGLPRLFPAWTRTDRMHLTNMGQVLTSVKYFLFCNTCTILHKSQNYPVRETSSPFYGWQNPGFRKS